MPRYTTREQEQVHVSIGDLRNQISVMGRSLQPDPNGGVDMVEVVTTVATLWAMVKTIDNNGRSMFDGTQVDRSGQLVGTHEFYTRYHPAVTQENWIDFRGERFDVLEITSFNEKNTFLKFLCKIRGANTLPTNEA